MKKILSLLLTGTMVLSLCACGNTDENASSDLVHTISPDATVSAVEDNENRHVEGDGFSATVGKFPNAEENSSNNKTGGLAIVNPWSDCESIEEAEEIVGFTFESIKLAEINSISVMLAEGMNIIQASFYDGDNKVTIRKSNAIGDISGDYRTFENVIKESREDSEMIYSGNGETFGLVTWVRDIFSYSISCENEVSRDILDSYVNVVFNDKTVTNHAVLYKKIETNDNFQSRDIIAKYSIPVMVRVIGTEED